MTDAARQMLLLRDGLQAVAEWEAEHGALTDAEMAAARRRLAQAVTDAAQNDESARPSGAS
jgi:TPP-dependent pyruvate/acetoin dehydrogenase alpha subunit